MLQKISWISVISIKIVLVVIAFSPILTISSWKVINMNQSKQKTAVSPRIDSDKEIFNHAMR